MDNPQAVKMVQAIRNLVQNVLHIPLAGLRQLAELGGPLDDVGERGLAELQGDVQEGGMFLLRIIANDCNTR